MSGQWHRSHPCPPAETLHQTFERRTSHYLSICCLSPYRSIYGLCCIAQYLIPKLSHSTTTTSDPIGPLLHFRSYISIWRTKRVLQSRYLGDRYEQDYAVGTAPTNKTTGSSK